MRFLFLLFLIAQASFGQIVFSNDGSFGLGLGFKKTLSLDSGAAPAPSRPQFALLRDVKSAATAGGTCNTSAYTQRALTEETITQDWVSLSGNQFTLTAGEYLIEAWSPNYYSGNAAAVLYSVTGSAIVSYGTNTYNQNASTSLQVQTFSRIQEVVDIGSNTTYEIRHQCTTANSNSLGIAGNYAVEEVYTIVSIRRLAD